MIRMIRWAVVPPPRVFSGPVTIRGCVDAQRAWGRPLSDRRRPTDVLSFVELVPFARSPPRDGRHCIIVCLAVSGPILPMARAWRCRDVTMGVKNKKYYVVRRDLRFCLSFCGALCSAQRSTSRCRSQAKSNGEARDGQQKPYGPHVDEKNGERLLPGMYICMKLF